MRALVVVASALTVSCASLPVVPNPPPVPPTAPATNFRVEFAQPEPPKVDQLFVCAVQPGGELWCVDYELFRTRAQSLQ